MADTKNEGQIIQNIRKVSKEPEDKLKLARERQNEERLRRIEELRIHAEAAQRYREQKDEEKKRRLEEMRLRDYEKRQNVEERKRAILEAEKERREYILKKNQERDSKIKSKNRDRQSMGFAFGSSTPRLLESIELSMVARNNFWGTRRFTSISNLSGESGSKRTIDRDISDNGSKSHTYSEYGNHNDDECVNSSQLVFRSVARRKTDLMPTVPTPREGHNSKSPLSSTPRTPGRVYSMNRLDQLAQPVRWNGEHIRAVLEREKREQMDETMSLGDQRQGIQTITGNKFVRNKTNSSVSRSMSHLPGSNSINSLAGSMGLSPRSHFSTIRVDSSRSGNTTPAGSSRPGSAMSTSTTLPSSAHVTKRNSLATRKQRPASIAGTNVTVEDLNKVKKENRPPTKYSPVVTRESMSKSLIMNDLTSLLNTSVKPTKKDFSPKSTKKLPSQMVSSDQSNNFSNFNKYKITTTQDDCNTKNTQSVKAPLSVSNSKLAVTTTSVEGNETNENGNQQLKQSNASLNENNSTPYSHKVSETDRTKKNCILSKTQTKSDIMDSGDMMTISLNAKNKITTEEEAKAALAERRRLAREEAERQAEFERQRIEMNHIDEIKRQKEEAERQRLFEEEAILLAEQQRKAEELRLQQAIEETKQKEKEERIKRENEERQRLEREDIERKAKEEAEKQKIEVAKKLEREEKEREERRKRVEAIMSRTRKGSALTPNKVESNLTQIHSKDTSQLQFIESYKNNEDVTTAVANESQKKADITLENSDKLYDQESTVKDTAIVQSLSSMVIEESNDNLHNEKVYQVANNLQQPETDDIRDESIYRSMNISNGNVHLENISNKEVLQGFGNVNLSIDPEGVINFTNNTLLTPTTAALVTSHSQENKDITLL